MEVKMDNYTLLKEKIARGWNTWNSRSVLSHVLLPQGFAINLGMKEYKDGDYLKEALIGRFEEDAVRIHPGYHTYDGSYTELKLWWKEMELQVQSAQLDDELILLVTPIKKQIKPATLVIESGILWNREGSISYRGEVLEAHLPGRIVTVYTTGMPTIDYSIVAQTPYLAIELDGPVGISTGSKRSIEEIEEILVINRAKAIKLKEAYGELSEAYNAMQSCMAWDTIYEPQKDRVVTPVSRIWNNLHGGYALFCWDTYFAAYLAAVDYKELAYCNAIEITREKTEEGFVPNCAWGNGFSSNDRSQPPVGSLIVRELYRKYRDIWLLEELFEDLYQWNTWFMMNRSLDDGTMAWGSNPYQPITGNYWENAGVNDTFGGALESGLDNSPMYDDIPFDQAKHRMMLSDVGLTGLYIMDCDCLAEIAAILGRGKEEAVLSDRASRCKLGIQSLWDEETGIYLNKRTDTNEFSHRLSPTNFYALFSEDVTAVQAKRMIEEHFYNSEEFWGDWIMPSIARNDIAYADQSYWRGRIWAPMNLLVYLGLRKHGLTSAQKDLAEKSRNLILKEWLEYGHVHENYSANTGEGCDVSNSDKFYHWGGLLSLIALIEAGYQEGPEKSID
jgi:hypothetical protein